MPNGLILDTAPQTYRNRPIFQATVLREKSSPIAFYRPVYGPPAPAKPIHAPEQPTRPSRVILAAQAAEYPRVAKDLGSGPYRNKFGATCVALVQAKGFSLQVGFAKNIPAIARSANYTVDLSPEKNAIFVTGESSAGGENTGHAGIIIDASDPDYVYVLEQNYRKGRLTEGWLPRSSIVAIVHI